MLENGNNLYCDEVLIYKLRKKKELYILFVLIIYEFYVLKYLKLFGIVVEDIYMYL